MGAMRKKGPKSRDKDKGGGRAGHKKRKVPTPVPSPPQLASTALANIAYSIPRGGGGTPDFK